MVGFILLVIKNDSKRIVQLIANATRIIPKNESVFEIIELDFVN